LLRVTLHVVILYHVSLIDSVDGNDASIVSRISADGVTMAKIAQLFCVKSILIGEYN